MDGGDTVAHSQSRQCSHKWTAGHGPISYSDIKTTKQTARQHNFTPCTPSSKSPHNFAECTASSKSLLTSRLSHLPPWLSGPNLPTIRLPPPSSSSSSSTSSSSLRFPAPFPSCPRCLRLLRLRAACSRSPPATR